MSSFLEHLGVSKYDDIPSKKGKANEYSWLVSLKSFMEAYRKGTSDADIGRRLRELYGWNADWYDFASDYRERLGLPAKGKWKGGPYESLTIPGKRYSLSRRCYQNARSPSVCYVLKSYSDMVDILLTFRDGRARFIIYADNYIELYQDLHVDLCPSHRGRVEWEETCPGWSPISDRCGLTRPIDVLLVSMRLSKSLLSEESYEESVVP